MKHKVLLVGMSSNFGGIENYLINIYRNINKDIFDIFFLSYDDNDLVFQHEIKNNIIKLKKRDKNYFKFIKETKNFFKTSNFDIIHFNLMSLSFFEPILIAKKYSNAKIILHSHTASFKSDSIKNTILNKIGYIFLHKKIFNLLCCSNDAGKFMFKNFNGNYTVVNNGINYDLFLFNDLKRKEIRNKLNIKDNEILLGNVGRMVKSKNHIFLLRLLSNILTFKDNYKILFIGDGPEKDNIIRYCEQKKLSKNVIFLSNIKNVNDYLNAMDLFVFPSKFEGLGIVLIEAQVNGLSCLINNKLPSEVDITNNIDRIDLNDFDKWLNTIINNQNRKDNFVITNYSFDIKETVKYIERYYMSL